MAKKIPLRQCVGCGEMKSKKEMMRVLKTPEETIVLDKTGKKNGRGAYLCVEKECLLKARKNKALLIQLNKFAKYVNIYTVNNQKRCLWG